MNHAQRAIAGLTVAFVLLFAVVGAAIVSHSGAQQQVAINTPAAQDLGKQLDPGTTTPGTTPGSTGTTAGTTPPSTQAENPGCEQDGKHDAADCLGQQLDPNGTTSGTSPPGSQPPGSQPPGTQPPGTNPPGTQAPGTTAAPPATTPPSPVTPAWQSMSEADRTKFLSMAVNAQKVARERNYDLGFDIDGGVTCVKACILSGGILGDTPQQMSVDVLAKMVKSPLALDGAARFILGDSYDDPRPVGDLEKAANDWWILAVYMVESFKKGTAPQGAGPDWIDNNEGVQTGWYQPGEHIFNTVVQNGHVVQFEYTVVTPRKWIRYHLGDVTLGFLESCGNFFDHKPVPGGPPLVPPPPELPPESTTTSSPPPTGGPTTPPPTTTGGKHDSHPVAVGGPTPTQVQGPGPTHPAGPPNTGINPGQPNPTTGCNPSPCQGATTTTTRAAPPSSAPVQPSQPKPSTPTTMGGP